MVTHPPPPYPLSTLRIHSHWIWLWPRWAHPWSRWAHPWSRWAQELCQGWGSKDGRQLGHSWRLRACELFVVRLWNDKRHLWNGLLPERGQRSAPCAVDGTWIPEGRSLHHLFGHVVSHVWAGGKNTALEFQVALLVWPAREESVKNRLLHGFSIKKRKG